MTATPKELRILAAGLLILADALDEEREAQAALKEQLITSIQKTARALHLQDCRTKVRLHAEALMRAGLDDLPARVTT